jgi:uncharacterized protein (TIGR02391 family)
MRFVLENQDGYKMAKLSTMDKQILEKAFHMGSGYVLSFADRTMGEFFQDDLGIDIYDTKYRYGSCSKANIMRGFWQTEEDSIVGKSIIKLIELIEKQIQLKMLQREHYPQEILEAARYIGKRLLKEDIKMDTEFIEEKAEGHISVLLQNEIYMHSKSLLTSGHYYNAVEEAFKLVRHKLKEITGHEKATDAFNEQMYEKIFGHTPINDSERDFFQGIKFLHMAIQFLRNEKAHTPAKGLEENMAFHYISLASLAYMLIARKRDNEE